MAFDSNEAELHFNGKWAVDALLLMEFGDWYIGITSPSTGKIHAIMPDPTGSGHIRLGGTGKLTVTNTETAMVEHFEANDLVVFQATSGHPKAPDAPA